MVCILFFLIETEGKEPERQVTNTQPEVIPKKENVVKVEEEAPKSSNLKKETMKDKEESQTDSIAQNETKESIVIPNLVIHLIPF